jgi:hypothetical protein
MNGGYTLMLTNGGEWDHRWSLDGVPDPEVDKRAFLRVMTDLVIQNDVRDWRRRFLRLEVPRQLRFNLNQAGWEVELERLFAR